MDRKDIFMSGFKSKIGYSFTYKDLAEFEAIIDFYEQQAKKQKEVIDKITEYITKEKNNYLHHVQKAIGKCIDDKGNINSNTAGLLISAAVNTCDCTLNILKDRVNFNLINRKSIKKFDFDLSDYYNKETRIFEFPKGYVAFSLMSNVFNTFLFPLDLVEEIKDVKD